MGLKVLDPLAAIAESLQVSMAAVSLAWVNGQPGMSSVLIGARTAQHLEDNLKGADLILAPVDQQRVGSLTAPHAQYPGWMIKIQSSGD